MKYKEAYPRLLALYGDVDRRVNEAGPVCSLSGQCCDFPRSGHVLFATLVETNLILDRTAPPPPEQECLCPFFRNRLCTLRKLRPLGCRIYFCDQDYLANQMTCIAEWAQIQVRKIHDHFGLPYRYAPFLDLLEKGNKS